MITGIRGIILRQKQRQLDGVVKRAGAEKIEAAANIETATLKVDIGGGVMKDVFVLGVHGLTDDVVIP